MSSVFDWHWCSLGVTVAYSESVTVTLVRLRPGSAMISDGSLLIEAGFVRFVSRFAGSPAWGT